MSPALILQRNILLSIAIATSLLSLSQAKCFSPSGSEAAPDFQPCSELGSICCALNRPNEPGGNIDDGFTKDVCQPNGLCLSEFVEDGETKSAYWRGFCTEQDWNTDRCLNVCTTGQFVADHGNTIVTPCDSEAGANSTTWCCGDSTSCCKSNPVTISPVFGEPIPTSTASESATSTTNTSPSSASTTSTGQPELDSQNNGSGLSTGAKAGIGIGAAVGALALLGLGFFIARSMQWKQKSQHPMGYRNDGTGADSAKQPLQPPPPAWTYAQQGYELSPDQRYEMDAYAPPVIPQELPNTSMPWRK